jgi:hypothetical protein
MTTDRLIKQHRTADASLTVMAGGTPLANSEVVVAQREHKFLFGNIGFDFIPLVVRCESSRLVAFRTQQMPEPFLGRLSGGRRTRSG